MVNPLYLTAFPPVTGVTTFLEIRGGNKVRQEYTAKKHEGRAEW